jgi:hypothetical protein
VRRPLSFLPTVVDAVFSLSSPLSLSAASFSLMFRFFFLSYHTDALYSRSYVLVHKENGGQL